MVLPTIEDEIPARVWLKKTAPPALAALAANVLSVTIIELLLEFAIAPPASAELFENVLLTTISRPPELLIAAPTNAEFPLSVLLVTVREPLFRRAPASA
jgi:hypothetical protein